VHGVNVQGLVSSNKEFRGVGVRFVFRSASNMRAAISADNTQPEAPSMNLPLNSIAAITALAAAAGSLTLQPSSLAAEATATTYHTAKVDGLNIFYREAGDAARPAVVLLHGFPSSSHMYRDLIPKLATHYHVIAPDYPGFGNSDQPSVADFAYTFDHLASVTDALLNSLKLETYSIYIQDYGSPVGFRLFLKHPERISAIITQNGNAYEAGLSPAWQPFRDYWADKSPANEAKLRGFLTLDTTRFQYSSGVRNPARVSPDAWIHDQLTLDKPGNADVQLALFYDYQNNLKQYDSWHAALRKFRPPVLAVWGKNDPFFLPAGAVAYTNDVPQAEVHLLDTGHFALEEDSDVIAEYVRNFLGRNVK
jgi:pimeloyl-ACP methyl ester carboxylesterase